MVSTDISITILVDNHAGDGLTKEHGLSMWIRISGMTILFDTGQGSALEKNAHLLGIDPSQADAIVLSHGHYDHTGGIPQVIREVTKAKVYCHPGVIRPRYAIRDGKIRVVEMPQDSKAVMDTLSSKQLNWVEQRMMLSDFVGITGYIPREIEFENTGGPFFLDPKGEQPDLIEDDLALWIQTCQGLVVCLGCCHAGLANTIRHIRSVSGMERVRAIIGGFHLMNADSQRIERTIDTLRSFLPEKIIPCHCTGNDALPLLLDALGERVVPGVAGTTYQF